MSSTTSSTKRRRKTRKLAKREIPVPTSATELTGLRLPFHDWAPWLEHLAERKAPPARLDTVPWLWGVGEPGWRAILEELVEFLDGLQRERDWRRQQEALQTRLDAFLESATLGDSTPQRLLEALAWAAVSPALARHVEEAQWLKLADGWQTLARRLPGISATLDPWTYHLTAELALTTAYLYPEVSTWAGQWTVARDALSHGICEWTDQEGLPVAPQLSLLRPLVACWTRCQILADAARQPCFHREAARQVVRCARQTVALTRHDGSQVLDREQPVAWDAPLFRALLKTFDDQRLRAAARAGLPCLAKRHKPASKDGLPRRASNVSEWSKFAALRTGWSHRSARLAVTFDQPQLCSEFSVGKHLLWSGPCPPEIIIDGERQAGSQELEVVCTFHDKEVEYVEVQMKLAHDWKLQRHMVLAVQDDFLLVADALIGPAPAQLDYQLRLPLAPGAEWERAADSREGWLRVHGERRALVLPLALPEWRAESSPGELESRDGQLVLRQSTTGSALFCPLFLDYSKKRRDQEFTWRRLTVAEDLNRVAPDVAVGYRVRVGADQWLAYRSLGRRYPRTVLGQHLLQEFVVGRFPKSGDLDLLLQVEASDE